MKSLSVIALALLIALGLGLVGNLAVADDKEAQEGQEIVLDVYGVECPGCARALTAALQEGGIEKASKLAPGRDKTQPVRVEAQLAEDADLSKAATAVNDARTPHRAKAPPALALVLFTDAGEESTKKLAESLEDVKGVDAKKSKADAKKGEIRLILTGADEVTIVEIVEALDQAGIEARTTKKAAKKQA
ncbi:MAG: hypothetical protein WD403_10015 [Pirellulales bacterium]